MTEYEVMAVMTRLEIRDASSHTVSMMYAETVAAISKHLSGDQLRRLLLCGAYIAHGSDRNAGAPNRKNGGTKMERTKISA
ncbi:hypothetical protein [Noviherbaspirillum galbum]|uniref:Uncharacterized protein n=1 Tax=Noviherbaspirillum galbum TaxID=2709383 RepID=A0A6B3SVP5_9BURK|nr:hypothetical protein [Noviherbaspirillum galbum]NEX64714.1 hypothetical protein [Noviherbaspirillum galbum]